MTSTVLHQGEYHTRTLDAVYGYIHHTLALGYGPDGIDYARHRSGGGDPAHGSIVRYTRMDDDECPTEGGELAQTTLSRLYPISVAQLIPALEHAANLSWVPESILDRCQPDRGERIPHPDDTPRDADGKPVAVRMPTVSAVHGHRMCRGLHDVFHQAIDRDRRGQLDLADSVHMRLVAEQVRAALLVMPDELWVEPTDPTVAHPDTRRCLGGPGRKRSNGESDCHNQVDWDARPQYCKRCEERFKSLFEKYPGEEGGPCRNVWTLDECKGILGDREYSLCGPCNRFRRVLAYQATNGKAPCENCGESVQDRGSLCWRCRKAESRSAA